VNVATFPAIFTSFENILAKTWGQDARVPSSYGSSPSLITGNGIVNLIALTQYHGKEEVVCPRLYS
jgi:hypothetical protein